MPQHVVSKKIYFGVFATLIILTFVTIEVAMIDLGEINTVAALTIAVCKATLVILYFMHVRYSSRLTWIVVGCGFFWLVIMIALTMSDYLSRAWIQTSLH
jgi:cytochrome c oxidase subunit 4